MKQTPAIKQSKRLARFDEKFSLLTNFLKKEKRFPGKTEDPKLYNWMSGLMHEKKNDRLEPEFVERLDSIGFIWSRRDFNKLQKGSSSEQDNSTPKLEARWAKRLEELKEYRQRNPVKWPFCLFCRTWMRPGKRYEYKRKYNINAINYRWKKVNAA